MSLAIPASLHDLVLGARFLASVPGFLRHPFSLDQARLILRERLEQRPARLLSLLQRSVFARPSSPYRRLLAAAGCEAGDLARLVSQRGVEDALTHLARQGVYVTVDELKGRRPLVRGSTRLEITPADLLNPLATPHLRVQTSGSRGAGVAVPVDLAFIRDHAVNTFLTLDTHGGVGWSHAHWGVPGGGALTNLLEFAAGGVPPRRWFSQVDPTAPGLAARYRWSGRLLRGGGLLAGLPLPAPEYVPLDDPLPIVGWMRAAIERGETPHLWTYASSAVRVAQAALAAGLSLEGARFTAGGEPSTAARLALIRRSGAEVAPRYGSTETDIIAYACQVPAAPDDMHLLHDRHAVIQPPADAPLAGLSPRVLLFTSLLRSTPLVLVNVSLGDEALLTARRCGCPLELQGWTTHLQQVRSFEKLTAGGMSFLDGDVAAVLEEVLPARLGGGPTHYQLVEEETDDGEARVCLLVDPAVGPLDEHQVAATFLEALGRGSGAERVMALQWSQAGLLRVERRRPLATASGKILHLHQARRLY